MNEASLLRLGHDQLDTGADGVAIGAAALADDEVFEAEVVEDDDVAVDEAAEETDDDCIIEEVIDDDVVDEPADEFADEGHADALAALAGDEPATGADALGAMVSSDDEPVDAIAAAEARDTGHAGDALASLAAGESFGEAPADDETSDPAEEFAFANDEHIHVDPARIRAVRQQQNRRAAMVHSTSFKKTMIPMLLIVGVLLLGIGVITGAMKGDPKAVGATMMDKYGTPMMAASLVLGLVLVAGAVLFHLDVRRTQEQEARQREQREQEWEQSESDA